MFKELLKAGKTKGIYILTTCIGLILLSSGGMVVENVYGNDGADVTALEIDNTQDRQLQEQLERLRNTDAYERQRAAIALGNLDNPEAVEPLMNALKDEDVFVRNFAAKSLGDLGDSRAVDALIQAMDDENLLVRRSAVIALGDLGSSKAVDPLIEKVKNGDDIVRRAAVEALGNLGDARGVETLIEALRDEDIFVRNGAEEALIHVGAPALPELVKVLSDWTLGPGILEILKNIEWQPSSDEEKIWVYVAERDRQSLLDNWETAKKVLIGDMEDAGNLEVQNAVLALIAIGQDEAIDNLVGILGKKGTAAIAKAFNNSGNPALIEAAQNWSIQNSTDLDSGDQNPVVEWGEMKSS
jgi:HEAT repeat protein